MKVREANTIARYLVDIWRSNLSTETGEVAEAEVICHDDKEVRSLMRAIGCV